MEYGELIMECRWFKYKSSIHNLTQSRGFNVRKLSKDAVMYESDLRASKTKKWVLYLDHMPIEQFKEKAEGLELAERIIRGDFDVKLK